MLPGPVGKREGHERQDPLVQTVRELPQGRRAELKKVTWPSKNEVVSTTVVVIAATIFFGFYLFFMDVIFSWVISQVKNLFG